MVPAPTSRKKKVSLAHRRKEKSLANHEKDNTITKPQRRKKKNERYARYIYRVFKQVNPEELTISKQAMIIMENFVIDIFEKLVAEASCLVHLSKRHTLSDRDIETAVKLIVPGELGKHAINDGRMAVQSLKNN